MALIKCNECGKEISDKSKTCIHCGCPIEKELVCAECGKKLDKNDKVCSKCGCPINESKENKKTNNIFTKIWLVICVLTCLFISAINFINIFSIANLSISIGNIAINVMGILALLLGGAYVLLFITLSKKSFYILLGINALILIYNISTMGMVINLFYIILVLMNSLITFFVVRKQLKNEKIKIKQFIPLFITLILAIALTFITSNNQNNYYDSDTNIGNERDNTIAQIEIITEYINIRSSKSVNSTIVGQVHYGEIYTIISEDENSSYNWYEIETADGRRGFIVGTNNNTDYVKELEIVKLETDEDKKEETTNKPNNNTNNSSKPNNNTSNNTNNSSKPNNNTQSNNSNNTNDNNTQSNNSNNTNDNNTNNNTSSNNPTTTEPTLKKPTISSVNGIGTIYTYKGTSCVLDSLDYLISRPFSSSPNMIQIDISYKATMTENTRGWDWCSYDLKVYDSNGTVVKTKPLQIKLGINEQGSATTSTNFNSEDSTFSLKIVAD